MWSRSTTTGIMTRSAKSSVSAATSGASKCLTLDSTSVESRPRRCASLRVARSPLAASPVPLFSAKYLEYGSNTIAIHTDAVTNGQRVLLVDDLLATGGTAAAAANLVAKAGGRVVESVFFIELGFLDGRAKMGDVPVRALVKY